MSGDLNYISFVDRANEQTSERSTEDRNRDQAKRDNLKHTREGFESLYKISWSAPRVIDPRSRSKRTESGVLHYDVGKPQNWDWICPIAAPMRNVKVVPSLACPTPIAFMPVPSRLTVATPWRPSET